MKIPLLPDELKINKRKLTDEQIAEMRYFRAFSTRKQTAQKFNVGTTTVDRYCVEGYEEKMREAAIKANEDQRKLMGMQKYPCEACGDNYCAGLEVHYPKATKEECAECEPEEWQRKVKRGGTVPLCNEHSMGLYNVSQPFEPEKPREGWEERFQQTKFAKGGGASFECSDYEGMYSDLRLFIKKELTVKNIELKEEFKMMIVEEINTAHTEGTPTARLTSLYNKI